MKMAHSKPTTAKAGQSKGALMAKREKPLPRLYGHPFQEGIEEIGLPAPELEGELTGEIASIALGYFEEVAARVKQRCSDEKLTGFDKRMDCELLVYMVGQSTKLVHYLMLEFELPFREVAEGLNQFPCMFPAHPESLRGLQKMLWDDFNLGKRNPLRLRPARGRKTFSFQTWVNGLLFHYYCEGYREVVLNTYSGRDAPKLRVGLERIFSPLSDTLTKKEVARQWLDIIWTLLLIDIPDPETHPRLRQLGGRPSKVHDVRATIKAKLGTYLERMLNDQAVHK
jgi:hypothetical protein